MSAQASFLAVAREGGRAALVTVVRGPLAGSRMLLRADGSREGGLVESELEARGLAAATELMWAERSELRDELFVDVVAPPPRVLIFGAVEYANHLSHLVGRIGWRPYVIDPRAQFATAERFPDAVEVVVAWPEEAVARLGGLDPATYITVLTHDPKIDDQVLTLALGATPAPAYIGAMGSKRAQAARRERLLEAGVEEEQLTRISAPIGLDLGAIGSEEVAVSIIGELLAVRYGRAGGRLSARGVAAGEHPLMAAIAMRLPEPGEVPRDAGTAVQENPDRPVFRGNGSNDYVCVSCGNVLAVSMPPEYMNRKLRIKCGRCRAVNVAIEVEGVDYSKAFGRPGR